MTPTARRKITAPEPERELVRRLIPYGPPAAVLALVAGTLAGGWGVGWSAAIGVAVIAANFAVSGLSVSRAARASVNMLFMVTGLGVIVRIGAIVGLLVILRQFAFFSTVAFALAVMPATLILIGLEMKLMADGVGRELHLPDSPTGAAL